MSKKNKNNKDKNNSANNNSSSNVSNVSKTMKKQNRGNIPSDVNGSYTGTDARGQSPEQDADDI